MGPTDTDGHVGTRIARQSQLGSGGERAWQTESGPSPLSGSQHLNPVGGDDAGVSGPRPIRLNKRPHERFDILRCCRMNPEQSDARLLQRYPALNGNPPEILVERQHDALFGFGQVQKGDVFPSTAISAGPKDVVAASTKCLDAWLRKVLVRKGPHLRWNRIGLVLVGQVAGVRQAGEDVLSHQSGVVR